MKQSGRICFYIFLLLLLLSVAGSYYRFMVAHDYVVGYEGDCDPMEHSCFIGCEDEECSEQYYYSHIERYAPALYEECGVDIVDCGSAFSCSSDSEDCIVTYCNASSGEDCATADNISSEQEDVEDETDIIES